MCDEWMPVLRIPMSIEQFHQLPRNPAYKYEYLRGDALLTPRARFYHARLDLSRYAPPEALEPSEPLELRPVAEADLPALKKLFRTAFHSYQPFASLDEATLKQAAERCLEKTWTGGDGPWLRQASFVAHSAKEDVPAGVILITLLPEGDVLDLDSYYWIEPPSADLIATRSGRPHLTWVFVHPWLAGQGAGSLLLQASVQALTDLGYTELLSTFLLGNHASTFWHWRNGFELLSHPFAVRRMRREIHQKNGRVTR
jgi:hypothetical protein